MHTFMMTCLPGQVISTRKKKAKVMEGNKLYQGIYTTEDNLELNHWTYTIQYISRFLEVCL